MQLLFKKLKMKPTKLGIKDSINHLSKVIAESIREAKNNYSLNNKSKCY